MMKINDHDRDDDRAEDDVTFGSFSSTFDESEPKQKIGVAWKILLHDFSCLFQVPVLLFGNVKHLLP